MIGPWNAKPKKNPPLSGVRVRAVCRSQVAWLLTFVGAVGMATNAASHVSRGALRARWGGKKSSGEKSGGNVAANNSAASSERQGGAGAEAAAPSPGALRWASAKLVAMALLHAVALVRCHLCCLQRAHAVKLNNPSVAIWLLQVLFKRALHSRPL
jgi:hypothetical protein